MSTKNQKNQQTSKSTNVKNEVEKLNVSQFTEKLKNKEFTETKERINLYRYPENLKTEKERNSKEGKKFRSSLRRNLERICTQVLLHTKYARTEDLKNAVKEFNAFYEKNYQINNFKIESISQSNKEDKTELIKNALEIIIYVNSQK